LTERLARRVAELTGESLTEAIRVSLEERYERIRQARSGQSLADKLNAIALRCASRPVISQASEDEILGYDEFGIPSR
jgi:antitoxin VapB